MMRKGILKSNLSSMDFRFTTAQETCTLCSNQCQMTIYDNGVRKTAWGLKCGRDYEDKRVKKVQDVSNLEKNKRRIFHVPDIQPDKGLLIGLPTAVYMEEYRPLFQLFFNNLGIRTIVETSDSHTLKEGKSIINSDFCAPINIALTVRSKNFWTKRRITYSFLLF